MELVDFEYFAAVAHDNAQAVCRLLFVCMRDHSESQPVGDDLVSAAHVHVMCFLEPMGLQACFLEPMSTVECCMEPMGAETLHVQPMCTKVLPI